MHTQKSKLKKNDFTIMNLNVNWVLQLLQCRPLLKYCDKSICTVLTINRILNVKINDKFQSQLFRTIIDNIQ